MSSGGSVFSATLKTITTTKLEELAKKRNEFEQQYSALLPKFQHEPNPLNRLMILVDGTKSCFGVKTEARSASGDGRLGRTVYGGTTNPRLETDLRNIDRFLDQARYDPSLSLHTIKEWEDSLLHYLDVQSLRFQYADLYGKLVTEWLSTEQAKPVDPDIDMAGSFEELPGAKKLESRAAWERAVFEPAAVDVAALNAYLNSLFGYAKPEKKGVMRAINSLREDVQVFEANLTTAGQFTITTLKSTIAGLTASDLLTNDQRAVLRDFQSNNVILTEVADVLNMRMAGLDSWTWGASVPVEQRRQLNGTFKIYMHEDLLQAIFLHYIGIKWSVFLKQALKEIRTNKAAWTSLCAEIPRLDNKRRGYYLGRQTRKPSVQNQRKTTHRKNYFLFQLLDGENQSVEATEGEEEAAFDDDSDEDYEEVEDMRRSAQKKRKTVHAMAYRQAPQAPARFLRQSSAFAAPLPPLGATSFEDSGTESDSEDEKGSKKPMQVKQELLHILSTEIAVNTRLNGEFTCFRSIFDQWNPSLPHTTILAVLAFFGISQRWQAFFKKFLEAPLAFMDEKAASPRTRQRGTPGSHALSDVFGEMILFCLDYDVNQKTGGAMLYRISEDIWFWSSDNRKVVQAWDTTVNFAKTMGVSLNRQKSGSVRITEHAQQSVGPDSRLPSGRIRWGFLFLNPKTGRFEIDQDMIDSHVQELRTQLQSKSKSIFDWVSAWNAYAATFFESNFGKAANCFGREHVDNMLATHRRIQENLFQGSSVVDVLKAAIRDRFGIENVPDGFFYFPVELGGLDLKSPFIHLLQIRETVHKSPTELLDQFKEAEMEAYHAAKRAFDKGDINHMRYDVEEPGWQPPEMADEFMSFEEYSRYREEFASTYEHNLHAVYTTLLRRPEEQSVDMTANVKAAIDLLSNQPNLRGITNQWSTMEPYWKWVTQLYGLEIVNRFGSLNVVDPRLLPIGMVSIFRERRINWKD